VDRTVLYLPSRMHLGSNKIGLAVVFKDTARWIRQVSVHCFGGILRMAFPRQAKRSTCSQRLFLLSIIVSVTLL